MTQESSSSDCVNACGGADPATTLDLLTVRHRAVLDLLLAGFETHKEIGLELGISPSTVRQRLDGAAAKLRTRGRGATKREYDRLLRSCAFSVCQSEHIPTSPIPPQQQTRDWGASPTLQLNDSIPFDRIAPWASVEQPTGLEAFVEKLNAVPAATIIVAQAVMLTILAVTVLTAMGTFSEYDFLRFVTQ